jgi:hypothetical protein
MTENLSRFGVCEYDKHTSIRGQPLNPINPPTVAPRGTINAQVAPGESRRDIAEHDLERQQPRPIAPRSATAAPASVVLRLNDTVGSVVVRQRATLRGG